MFAVPIFGFIGKIWFAAYFPRRDWKKNAGTSAELGWGSTRLNRFSQNYCPDGPAGRRNDSDQVFGCQPMGQIDFHCAEKLNDTLTNLSLSRNPPMRSKVSVESEIIWKSLPG